MATSNNEIISNWVTSYNPTNWQVASTKTVWWTTIPWTWAGWNPTPMTIDPNSPQARANAIWNATNPTPTNIPPIQQAPTQNIPTPVNNKMPDNTLLPTAQNPLTNQTTQNIPTPNVEKTTTAAPTGTTTVTKETPAPVIDQNARKDQIISNLNEGYKNDQTVQQAINTGNFDQFKAKYNMANPDEAKIVQDYFNAHKPQNSDQFFNILSTWWKIDQSVYNSNPEAAKAQHIYDILNPYKWASVDSLYAWMTNNQIVPWSVWYQDLIKLNWWIETPEMIEAKQKYQAKVNSDIINNSTDSLLGNTSDVNNPKNISDKIVNSNWIDYAKQFQQQVVNNPTIIQAHSDLNDVNWQILDLETASKKIIRDIESSHPWISTWLLYEVANEQQRPINDQLNLLYNKSNILSSNLQYQTDLAEKMYDYQNKQEITQQSQNFQMWLQKQGQQFTAGQTQISQQFQKDLFNLQQQFNHPDINSTNPSVANIAAQDSVKNAIEFYQTHGIQIWRGQGQIIQDAQQYAKDNNVSLWTALSKTFTEVVQNWNQYKNVMDQLQNQGKYAFSPYGEEYNTRTWAIIDQNWNSTNPSNWISSTNTGSNWGNWFSITNWTTQNRPDRNNNPWNLRVTWDTWKKDNGWFGIFSTPQAWFQAMIQDVSSKVNGTSKYSSGIKTLQDLINVYAPAWDWNNPNSYASIVAKSIWVSPNTPISQLQGKEVQLASAMAKHEWFTGSITAWVSPTNQNNQSNNPMAPNSNGSQAVSQNSDWSVNYADWTNSLTSQWDIKMASVWWWIQEQPNQYTDAQIMALRGAIARQSTGSFNIRNEWVTAYNVTGLKWNAWIQKMQQMMSAYSTNPEYTTQDKKIVDQVVNGQKYNEKLDPQGYIKDAILAKDPTWNPNDFSNENKVKLLFTAGKIGDQVSAADTAIDHMNDYKELLAANWNTQLPAVNDAWNRLKSFFWLEWPVDLQVLAWTVWDELAKTYNINAEWGKEAKGADFAAKLSPDQWAGAVNTQIKLLAQKIGNTYKDQWKPIMKNEKNQAIEDLLDKAKTNTTSGKWPTTNNQNLNDLFDKYYK